MLGSSHRRIVCSTGVGAGIIIVLKVIVDDVDVRGLGALRGDLSLAAQRLSVGNAIKDRLDQHAYR